MSLPETHSLLSCLPSSLPRTHACTPTPPLGTFSSPPASQVSASPVTVLNKERNKTRELQHLKKLLVQGSRSIVAQHAQRVQQLSAEATSNSKNDIMDRLKESDARLANIKAQVSRANVYSLGCPGGLLRLLVGCQELHACLPWPSSTLREDWTGQQRLQLAGQSDSSQICTADMQACSQQLTQGAMPLLSWQPSVSGVPQDLEVTSLGHHVR